MLIRVHDESFVLFFYNSFILLDKKPLLLVTAFLTGLLADITIVITCWLSYRCPDDGHVHVTEDHKDITRSSSLNITLLII